MTRCRVGAALLAAASLWTGAGTVHANRPLVTDTADTIPDRRCQFEPYAGRTRSDGAPGERFWVLQVNCGAAAHTQLGASATRAWSDDDSEQGLAIGGKSALIALGSGQTGIAVNYGLSASRPRGASWRGEGAGASLIATRELAEGWLVHANLGWARSRSAHQSSTTYAAATEVTAVPGIVLSAELYGDDRSSRPWLGAGVLWQIREGLTVNASYAVQRSDARVRQFTAGFLIEF
jgi:hypothetical protein